MAIASELCSSASLESSGGSSFATFACNATSHALNAPEARLLASFAARRPYQMPGAGINLGLTTLVGCHRSVAYSLGYTGVDDLAFVDVYATIESDIVLDGLIAEFSQLQAVWQGRIS